MSRFGRPRCPAAAAGRAVARLQACKTYGIELTGRLDRFGIAGTSVSRDLNGTNRGTYDALPRLPATWPYAPIVMPHNSPPISTQSQPISRKNDYSGQRAQGR